MEWVREFISQYGYIAIFLLLALGVVGLPVPDELMMSFVGYLSSIKVLDYWFAILVGCIGALTGMMISYMIGRRVGKPLIHKYGKWIGLTAKRFEKVEHWFFRFGPWALVIGYFIPGFRHVTGYISGISVMPFKKYVCIVGLSSMVWTFIFVTIGYYIGVVA